MKPGVEEAEPQVAAESRRVERAKRAIVETDLVADDELTVAHFGGCNEVSHGTWGFARNASLHPRLYAIAALRGLGTNQRTVKTTIDTRDKAISRGLDFIYRVASKPEGFDRYGSLSTCCFGLVAATSRDASLRQLARSRAQKLARRWRRLQPFVPPDATTDLIFDCVMVSYALSRLGLTDVALKAQLPAAVKLFCAQDLLGFDPATEPPPDDLPYQCDCGFQNQRGRKSCKQCRRRLEFQSRYRVWMEALSNTYVGERCGVIFGTPYRDVLKWLPKMRPYPGDSQQDEEFLREAIYAVTHIVYTLNDYSTYRLRPAWLPQEFAFLKANVDSAIERNDPEVLGELLDTLKAFGLRDTHRLIQRGTKFLLATQNEDGSWGDPDESIRTRCHTTWTAVDGLRKHAWRGERLRHRVIELGLIRGL